MLLRVSLTLSWVSFLQATGLKYLHPDIDLQDYSIQAMDMLRLETSVDVQALKPYVCKDVSSLRETENDRDSPSSGDSKHRRSFSKLNDDLSMCGSAVTELNQDGESGDVILSVICINLLVIE